jgi:hypothetical protein
MLRVTTPLSSPLTLALTLAVALASAAPSAAAEKPVRIRLRYAQVSDLFRLLEPPREAAPTVAFTPALDSPAAVGVVVISGPGASLRAGAASPRPGEGGLGGTAVALIPPGLTSWTADTIHNTLVVTGPKDAVARLKDVIRLLDVPARAVKLEVRTMHKTAPLGDGGAAAAPAGSGLIEVRTVPAAEVEGIPASDLLGQPLPATVLNNHTLMFRLPGREGSAPLEITPRVNGDGTITLLLGQAGRKPFAVRRVERGRAMVSGLPGSQELVAITVRAVRDGRAAD